ncbi:MAG: hypothetical protein Q4C60_00575 [Eubacteriales bacterium]|nr:hypothetical protein [Eubacteriales bacterium]
MININAARNKALLAKCPVLYEYSELTARIRAQKDKGLTLAEAVRNATASCIADGILSKYLSKHRAEVMNMFLTEYDEQAIRELDHDEGKQEGRQEALFLAVQNLIQATGMSSVQAMDTLGVTGDDRDWILKGAVPKDTNRYKLDGLFSLDPTRDSRKYMAEEIKRLRGGYDEQTVRETDREEGKQEGLQEGVQRGLLRSIQNLMKTTGTSPEEAMDMLMVPEEERPALLLLLP